MKRVLTSLAGLAGLAALGRALRRRRRANDRPDDERATPAASGDPAEKLRRTLAAQRPSAPETPPTTGVETLEERRARVHAKAREAMDEMHDGGEPAA